MGNQRYLTKSKFKLAMECPSKLFYIGKKEYANQSLDDSLLLALADGGFQVGALAKCYFPGGHEIETLDYDEALNQTNELLKLKNVIIYEAAIATKKLFIRADILVKKGNKISLYEVKAKSFRPSEENPFRTKWNSIKAEWQPYLYDVAFQKYVIEKAFPNFEVSANLMLVNKSSICPTDGLNQKFRLVNSSRGHKVVSISENLTEEDLNPPILSKIKVDEECDSCYKVNWNINNNKYDFKHLIDFFATNYINDIKISYPISRACENCEFNTTEKDLELGLLSGKKECWKEKLNWEDKDFLCPSILDIWNFRKKNEYIKIGKIKMKDFSEFDINIKSDDKPGLSPSERQWLQIEKVKNNDDTIWIGKTQLKNEINSWRYPLHFIDFETAMVAIPFNAGRKPYEGIAFQFSHHIVYKDGTVEHAGEFLNTQPGVFPNYDFVRTLKLQLENNMGTIFTYSQHENTYLNFILKQLQSDKSAPSDAEELCEFIKNITVPLQNDFSDVLIGGKQVKYGFKKMVDMLELVKRYYYDPITNGSNSIKAILPSIINRSDFIKEKYSKPIYGAKNGIKSLNYIDWQWIKMKNGKAQDPYKLLPKMFEDIEEKNMELLSSDTELRNGGAALTAYARMQFEEMSDYERVEIQKALLKYCELDTLAMVMIYEGWVDLIK